MYLEARPLLSWVTLLRHPVRLYTNIVPSVSERLLLDEMGPFN
jgi:hypothetical protein